MGVIGIEESGGGEWRRGSRTLLKPVSSYTVFILCFFQVLFYVSLSFLISQVHLLVWASTFHTSKPTFISLIQRMIN